VVDGTVLWTTGASFDRTGTLKGDQGVMRLTAGSYAKYHLVRRDYEQKRVVSPDRCVPGNRTVKDVDDLP